MQKAMYIFRILTLGLSLFWLAVAVAQDPYEVSAMRLDVTGDSDQEAKNTALALAEEQAFEQLLKRLLLRKDANRQAELRRQYKGAALSLLIADLRITDEKFGSGRYLADVTVRFKPHEVRRIFAENKLAYAETYSPPLLVLALQKQGGRTALWADDNRLLQVVRGGALPEGLLPFVAPYGDIEDINLLNPQVLERLGSNSTEGTFRRFDFAEIIQRYNVGGVVFMQGEVQTDSLVISGRMLASGDSIDFPPLRFDIGAIEQDEQISVAVLAALENFQETWKSRNLISDSDTQTLHAVLAVRDLPTLHNDLRTLRRITTIDKAHLLRLSTRQAVVSIDFRSSVSQLRATLFNLGLRLDKRQSTGNWYLRRL